MKRTVIIAATCLGILAGCAARDTPEQLAFLHTLADRPVTCTEGADCEDKWNRAIGWVSAHTREGIRTIEDNLIAANAVSTGGRDALHAPEFTVVRYKVSPHTYRMRFTSYCDQNFECGNVGLKFRAGFVTAVIGLPEAVTEPRPGVFQKTITR